MIATCSKVTNQADFVLLTMIVAWPIDHIQADFAIVTVITTVMQPGLQTLFKLISPC